MLKRATVDLVRPDDMVIFDYDGTLADFVPDPKQATVPRQVIDDLGALSQRQPVIVISGRSVDEIDTFLAPLKLPLSGAHGRQFRASGTAQVEAPALPNLPESLWRLAHDMVRTHPGVKIEEKDAHSFGFHVRPMAEERRQAALDEFWDKATPLLAGTRYKLQPGNMVIEVCPTGFDKGQAVAHFLSMPNFRGRRAVFFGDDLTDDYAFRRLAEDGSGFGVLVGPRAFDPAIATAAQFMLDSPSAMRAFLRELVG